MAISRHHCVFLQSSDNNSWKLKDSSTNGTKINGKLIKDCESDVLQNGDYIVLSVNGYSYKFEDKITNPIIIIDNEVDSKLFDPSVSDEQLCYLADAVLHEEEVITEPKTNPEDVVVAEDSDKEESCRKKMKMDNNKGNDLIGSAEDELTCSICSELFIKAVTLQCSHTFCKYCIETWKSNKSICPICRTKIATISPTLAIDNIVTKLVENLPKDRQELRKQMVEQRNTINQPSTSKGTINLQINESIMSISSDDSYQEENDDYSWNGSDEELYDDYDGIPGVYYGGYGRCYSCGRPGHWANGCPFS